MTFELAARTLVLLWKLSSTFFQISYFFGGRKLVVQSVSEQRLTLDELLRGVTDQNLHGEWDSGPAVGREIW